tara:strand:- start:55 stop:597 length:543 start_codon:yes stop_codon:yes gene_type:complete
MSKDTIGRATLRLREEYMAMHKKIAEGNWGDFVLITQEVYSELYRHVYDSCTQKKKELRAIGSHALYNLVQELATTYPLPESPGRDAFVKFWEHVFKYLDRFYVRRLSLTPLKELMIESMNNGLYNPRADMLRLKKAFRKWSLNEDLFAPLHAKGGAALKRACEWWSENTKRPKHSDESE